MRQATERGLDPAIISKFNWKTNTVLKFVFMKGKEPQKKVR
jgi:hypothetical protein